MKKFKGNRFKKTHDHENGTKHRAWRVASFVTDAVKLSNTFISGFEASSPNIQDLVKKVVGTL